MLAELEKERQEIKPALQRSSVQSKNLKFKDFKQPTPIDEEIQFKYDELFFSLTDKKSRITFGNEVFTRLSGYSNEELSGQLHKLIRHPDMPRAVYKIFWDYLKADKPVAAYVKNMAKSGKYYWVMALVLPTPLGYQSIRLRPGSELFSKVKDLYTKTLRFEKNQELQGDKQQAMEQAEEFLLNELKSMGFKGYEEFMLHALEKEIHNRERNLRNINFNYELYSSSKTPSSLIKILRHLTTLFCSLNDLNSIQKALNEHSDYILNLAQSILLLSLNAQIGSTKLDKKDISLSVVAEKMGEQSMLGEQQLLQMKDSINELHELGSNMNFHIVFTKLQVEMCLVFLKEIAENKIEDRFFEYTSDQANEQLIDAFKPRLQKIITEISELPDYLAYVIKGVQDIEKFLMVLRFIHITGKVEIARMTDNFSSFSTTFNDLIQEIETAEVHLKKLSDVVLNNKDIGNLYANISEQLSQMFEELIRS